MTARVARVACVVLRVTARVVARAACHHCQARVQWRHCAAGCSCPSSARCAAATAVCLPAAGCIGALGFERAGCGCSSGVVARPLRRLLLLSELTTLRGLRCRRLACSSRTSSLLWRDRPRALAGGCQGCLGAAGSRPQPLRRPPPDALDGAAAAIVSTRRVFLFSALPG